MVDYNTIDGTGVKPVATSTMGGDFENGDASMGVLSRCVKPTLGEC